MFIRVCSLGEGMATTKFTRVSVMNISLSNPSIFIFLLSIKLVNFQLQFHLQT